MHWKNATYTRLYKSPALHQTLLLFTASWLRIFLFDAINKFIVNGTLYVGAIDESKYACDYFQQENDHHQDEILQANQVNNLCIISIILPPSNTCH